AIGPLVADHLGDLLGILGGDALLQADEEAVLLAGRLGLIRNVQDLQGQLPPDQPLLEDVQGRVRALLGAARDLDPVLALPSDGGPGALEVEPLGHFLGGLVQGVVDLLSVELGHDVETGFGGQRVLTPRLFSQWIASTCGYPRGRFGSAWGPDTASELSRGLDGGRCCDLPESLAHETDFALRP